MKNPDCFILLTQIAQRAKRTNDFNIHNLKLGEALIGDYKNIGLTRQQYRTATKKLENWQFITIKTTNKGTIATLINTDVFDINVNLPTNNLTIKQPSSNHQATTNKNDKNEKNTNIADTDKKPTDSRQPKDKYLEFVKLSNPEHKKLVALFGEEGTAERIENLNDYIGSKGNKYKSHYHTILVWERKNKPVEKEFNEWG